MYICRSVLHFMLLVISLLTLVDELRQSKTFFFYQSMLVVFCVCPREQVLLPGFSVAYGVLIWSSID